jgi:excinuclease ABC subunit A
VIDLSHEGGEGGGEIVVCGPPEDIVKAPRSYTGKFRAGAGEGCAW